MHDKHHTTEERNEGKLSRSVLETSGTGDSLAEFNRSAHDAIGAVFTAISLKSKYVLDADISKCFDRINHEKLLSKLNTTPTLRRQIRAWLKAGVMDGKKLFPTEEGTPQGGVLSPLLANVALHGLEELIKGFAPSIDMKRTSGTQVGKRSKIQSISLIRYADDFVVLHEQIDVINRCKEIIEEWLSEIGLELKPSKTRIAHTLNKYEDEKPGFKFLGFEVRQYAVGKHQSGKNGSGKLLGFKIIIKPSKEGQKRHYRKLAEVIEKLRGEDQATLIYKLNPIIRGWCNYYSTVVSKEVFSRFRHLVVYKLLKWGLHKHRNKGRKWIKDRYFHHVDGDNWTFAAKDNEKLIILRKHTETKIRRYVKVKGDKSPYDGDWLYWCNRMGEHPEVSVRVATLLKKQKGKCSFCGNYFNPHFSQTAQHRSPKATSTKA
jgi:RNA-directed DNA polymerase